MKLLCLTDTHFDFKPSMAPIEAALLRNDYAGVLLTGDISVATRLRADLESLKALVIPLPVYFVLGNHDYYKGSFESVARDLTAKPLPPDTHWLRKSKPIDLGEGVVLTGHDGMYDVYYGFGAQSNLIMRDFIAIEDWGEITYREGVTAKFIGKVRATAAAWAAEAEANLLAALALSPSKILFATHFPPFAGACWHEGKMSDGNWLPWFTSSVMGEVLSRLAKKNPTVSFEVYCGHTHSPGFYRHGPNLVVFTGRAVYGEVCPVEIDLQQKGPYIGDSIQPPGK